MKVSLGHKCITNETDSIFVYDYHYKTLIRAQKRYELTSLPNPFGIGNVLVVKNNQYERVFSSSTFVQYKAVMIQAIDYTAPDNYKDGAPLPRRSWVASVTNGTTTTINVKTANRIFLHVAANSTNTANSSRIAVTFTVSPTTTITTTTPGGTPIIPYRAYASSTANRRDDTNDLPAVINYFNLYIL